MGRLSLVIADKDKDYLMSLEKYLVLKYPQRFDIFLFSSGENLSGFLKSTEQIDIMLINSKMYSSALELKPIDTVVILSENEDEPHIEGFERVKKFQHIDKLVTDIFRIHSSRTSNTCLMSGGKNTRIICAYSPAGGTGKTSIAAGCSILCAGLGLKTLYLNMENIPSTKLYFKGDTDQSFSNAIFHIKGKDKNLGIKLEGAKAFDRSQGVYFFAEPENILEMEELTGQDIECLVKQFKIGRIYDVVFVDMSCGLNPRNAALLGSADSIVNVIDGNDTASSKMRSLMNGIEALENRSDIKIREKMINVINKCDIAPVDLGQQNPVVLIGNFSGGSGNRSSEEIAREPAFLSRLNKLLEYILPQGSMREKKETGVS